MHLEADEEGVKEENNIKDGEEKEEIDEEKME